MVTRGAVRPPLATPLVLVLLTHLHERLLTTLQRCKAANRRCIASSLHFLWYGSIEWNMEENFSMELNMEWKTFSME